MDARNLSIVFNGVIFGEEELPKLNDILSLQNIKVYQPRSTTSFFFLSMGLICVTGYGAGRLDYSFHPCFR